MGILGHTDVFSISLAAPGDVSFHVNQSKTERKTQRHAHIQHADTQGVDAWFTSNIERMSHHQASTVWYSLGSIQSNSTTANRPQSQLAGPLNHLFTFTRRLALILSRMQYTQAT